MAYLLSANLLVSLIGLLTVAITARALGPLGLGILALAEAYVRLVDQLVRLEPWQAVIRYGAIKLEQGKDLEFRRLVKLSTMFDLCGAALAALVAIAFCRLTASWLGYSEDQAKLTAFYAISLFFAVSSTPTGLMRVFDRFDILAKMSVALALIRLGLSVLAWQLSGDAWTFITILFVYTLAEQLIPLALAWRELRRRGHVGIWTTPLAGVLSENPNILRFIVNANINALARLSTQRLDTLIVGAVLGNSAAGFYHLARRIGLAAVKFGRPLQQAIFPDIAKIWAQGDRPRFRRLVFRANGLLTLASLLGAAAAYPLVDWIVAYGFGAAFLPSVPLIKMQFLAVVLFLASNTLGPALMTIGADRAMVWISLVATIAFFATIFPFMACFGAAGAILSQALFSLIVLAGTWSFLLWLTRPPAGPASPASRDK
ncbi:MAG: lipopolysaccharide biosynthesis protein [Aestuariivirga sp.]